MVLLAEFPGEIVSRILSNIDDIDLYECMKTCKLWHRLGSPRRYKHVTIHDNHTLFLEYTQLQYHDQTKLGEYIESLTIIPWSHVKIKILTEEQFTQLMSNLPNLHTIHFDPEYDAQTIVEYMVYFKKIAQFYKNIQQVSIPETLDYGHTHSGYRGNKKARKVRRYHYMVNRILHNQITTFTLSDLDVRMLKGSANRLLKSLAKFKQLKSFSLYVSDTREYYESSEELQVTTVLDACPHLEFLEFKSSMQWLLYTTHTPFLSLTSLALQLPSLDKKNVQYLLQHVPNLKQLKLDMYYKTALSELLTSLDTTTASQFTTLIKKLDVFKLESSSEGSVQDHSCLWGFIRDIYDPTMKCHLVVEFRSRMVFNENLSFDHSNNTFTIHLEWILRERLESSWVDLVDFINFASLDIQYHDYRIDDMTIGEFMQTRLLEKQTYAKFCNYEQWISLTDINGNNEAEIRRAHLKNLIPDDDILPTIGRYYPFIEEILMEDCDFSEQFLIDVRQFDNVHRITFDIDLVMEEVEDISHFYVQCVNDKEVDCYCYERDQQKIIKVNQELLSPDVFLIKVHYTKLGLLELRRNETLIPIVFS